MNAFEKYIDVHDINLTDRKQKKTEEEKYGLEYIRQLTWTWHFGFDTCITHRTCAIML